MRLPDIQDERDHRGIELDQVGVAGVRYPVTFADGDAIQAGVATVDVTVALQADRRGTHMSRMIELVHEHLQYFDPRDLPRTLKGGADRLDADRVHVRVRLPLTFALAAPQSQRESFQVCDVTIEGNFNTGDTEVVTTVTTDVTSLCPCSKAISDYGAHNQRSNVVISAVGSGDDVYPLPVRAGFELIRSVGSAAVYPLIKRTDERAVTMQAHDHPAFVEDMARDLSEACRVRGVAHRVRVRNLESIHSHDAVASVSWAPA